MVILLLLAIERGLVIAVQNDYRFNAIKAALATGEISNDSPAHERSAKFSDGLE